MQIILASQSPRRKELLSRLAYDFTVCSCDIDESRQQNETPTDYLKRMVAEKANAFISESSKHSANVSSIESESTTKNRLVLTADTIGVMPNGIDILVKPIDKADAFRMWQAMSNQKHFVWTAVQATVIDGDGQVLWQKSIIEKTEVQFIELSNNDMESYWQTGEPADKAGGYAIQGLAAAWVDSIHGSYTNVVGFPLAQVKQLIIDASIR